MVRGLVRFALLLALTMVPGTVLGQTGAISGVVRDSSGGVIPGAAVRAIQVETAATVEAVTDAQGAFSLAVPSGQVPGRDRPRRVRDGRAAGGGRARARRRSTSRWPRRGSTRGSSSRPAGSNRLLRKCPFPCRC